MRLTLLTGRTGVSYTFNIQLNLDDQTQGDRVAYAERWGDFYWMDDDLQNLTVTFWAENVGDAWQRMADIASSSEGLFYWLNYFENASDYVLGHK